MVLVCNKPNQVDILINELKWLPGKESLKRIQLMKLNKNNSTKNSKSYCNESIEAARSIITGI